MTVIGPGRRAERPLVILGPTASGKSTLALEVAVRVPGAEIVSVDSMQVYRGMDIGTATPSAAERDAVPHHLVDLVSPEEEFTVGAFQRAARAVLDDLRGRGAVPLLVGGTGLHLRAVIDDLDIPGRFPAVRTELEADPDTEAMHRRLAELDPVAAGRMEPGNRRRVIRALEVTIGSDRPFSSYGAGLGTYAPSPFVQIGLRWPREELDRRIARRYEEQMEAGFLDEVRRLAEAGLGRTAGQALGYRELLSHLTGECSLQEALDLAVRRTSRFARRQERWFRRDPRVRWLDAPVPAEAVVRVWDEVRAIPAGS
jgi:tRNA dimethylallyltransferase